MIFSAQYYRPPFPNRRFWADDLRRMRESGLNTMYVWAVWGWIEPEPGVFRWDDYDELFALAKANGLNVVVNIIGELHPHWIHREVPDANMVDHTGRVVGSELRMESNVGITPGGCTDHPRIRELMGRFLTKLAERYGDQEHLVAWDLWNETRWAIHAGGYVCYCDHTINAYRDWLRERHGDLDGLNAAWQRRYSSWEDVFPSRAHDRPHADSMAYYEFLTHRSAEHMRFRAGAIRGAQQRERLVVAHAMNPAVFSNRYPNEQPLSRGNDWDYLEFLDGFGSSHFPTWFSTTTPEYGARLEASRSASAALGKLHWVGEVQGGGARAGIEVRPPVRGAQQQRWVWTAVARGAKAINFWCWRDEVFGRESSGFGLSGGDGFAEERLAALATTGALFEEHAELIDAYEPDAARIGVVFDPINYYQDFAQYAQENEQAAGSVAGYLHALERLRLPYEVIESRHRARLAGCRIVVMPSPLHVEPGLAEELLAWVREGGTLLMESEADAFDDRGFYRYPGERPFAEALGVQSLGRRIGEVPESAWRVGEPGPSGVAADHAPIAWDWDGARGALPPAGWLEPYATDSGDVEVLGSGPDGALVIRRAVGAGQVVAVGTFAGLAAWRAGRSEAFEAFVEAVVERGGGRPDLVCEGGDGEDVQWRLGRAGDARVLIVTNAGAPATLTLRGAALDGVAAAERLDAGGATLAVDGGALALDLDREGYALLRW